MTVSVDKNEYRKRRRRAASRETRRIIYTALILTLIESSFVLHTVAATVAPLSTSSSKEDNIDSDEILRSILINYYNLLERHKQHQSERNKHNLESKHDDDTKVEQTEEKYKEEENNFKLLDDSVTNSVIEYVKDHIKTRVWSGLFRDDRIDDDEVLNNEEETQFQKEQRLHDYRNPEIWWEDNNEEPNTLHQDTLRVEGSLKENPTKQMVNRIFTASGFALSFVVLVIFFLACTYCWCISSPSKMLGAISTVLAMILLLHRLHEFFLVFSPEDLKNVGSALIGNGGDTTLYYEANPQ